MVKIANAIRHKYGLIRANGKTKRYSLGALGLLAISVGAIGYVYVNRWPCGRFDSTSGCVRNVKLQTDALNFEEGTLRVNHRSFDLSSDTKTALVGLQGVRLEQVSQGLTDKRLYGVVALFNTQDGSLIRILREFKGTRNRASSTWSGRGLTQDIALSPDGSLVASYGIGENDNSLIVQRTADGTKVKTIFERRDFVRRGCYSMLDFSDNNQALQCRSIIHQLNSDQFQRLADKKGKYIYPFIADSSLMHAVAPDGTRIRYNCSVLSSSGFTVIAPGSGPKRIEPRLNILGDTDHHFMFSSDSQFFMEGYRNRKVKGLQRLIPPPLRRLSAVAIWTRNADFKQMFFTNKRYRNLAWSRDSTHFALINQDLSLQVFKAL